MEKIAHHDGKMSRLEERESCRRVDASPLCQTSVKREPGGVSIGTADSPELLVHFFEEKGTGDVPGQSVNSAGYAAKGEGLLTR
jgi:hypothetical protein